MTRSGYCRLLLLVAVTQTLSACVAFDSTVADGRSTRALIAAQIDDPGASDRHGTKAPQGTDPEVAASAVEGVRQRGREASDKPGLFDILLRGIGGK